MDDSTKQILRRILAQRPAKALDDSSLIPAGVLLLLYSLDHRERIMFNVRSNSVEHHKGEIAFPGGRWSEGDGTLRDTALRETCEEMGVDPRDVDVLGQLDDVATISSYLIRPYVGTIPAPYDFRPNQREVAQVVEAPLDALMDPRCLRDTVRIVDGALVHWPSYVYQGHLIFGATAEVLAGFLERISDDGELPWGGSTV